MLTIRLNQLAAAGSGVHPRLLEALQTALRVGALPLVHASAAENPLIDVDSGEIDHHGQFSTAYLALALDHARAALHRVTELSTARLGDLVEPDLTGLAPFLAAGPVGSSGIMILEYVAHDALAQLVTPPLRSRSGPR